MKIHREKMRERETDRDRDREFRMGSHDISRNT